MLFLMRCTMHFCNGVAGNTARSALDPQAQDVARAVGQDAQRQVAAQNGREMARLSYLRDGWHPRRSRERVTPSKMQR